VYLRYISDIIPSGIQQEQNSESTDVDEPFSPSTKETLDLDFPSPQAFSAVSNSIQHGVMPAKTAAVDTTAEMDLVDSTSASLLLQLFDVTVAEETEGYLYKPTVSNLDTVQEKSETVFPDTELKSEDRLPIYEESFQQHHQDVICKETSRVIEDQQLHRSVMHAQSADIREAAVDEVTEMPTLQMVSAGRAGVAVSPQLVVDVETADVDHGNYYAAAEESLDWLTAHYTHICKEEDVDKRVEEIEYYISTEDSSQRKDISTDVKQKMEDDAMVGVSEADDDKELSDDEQRKHAETVSRMSISGCSSIFAENKDDIPKDDDAIIVSEEESSCKKLQEIVEYVESNKATETYSQVEVLSTILQQDKGQLLGFYSEEATTSVLSDHWESIATQSLTLKERGEVDIEQNIELEAAEPSTPKVERNLSQYQLGKDKDSGEVVFTGKHEKHERMDVIEGFTESHQLHDTKLLCSSNESLVSSTTSDWTVIDIREKSINVDSNPPVDKDEKDIQQQKSGEQTVYTHSCSEQSQLDVSQESRQNYYRMNYESEGFVAEPIRDEDEINAMDEDYMTAAVTPTVDLIVMSTALESIIEEEERTSSSQKTTSSSEKLEHDMSGSSKLVGSSADVQHAAESPTFQPNDKVAGEKSSDKDDLSVSSSLAEFERLERELQEKGSSESFSGDKGSSESASAAALPESPQRKSSTSLSSSLAEFERIEHEILGQCGSLELIALDRKGQHTDSSSFSELERIEEMDRNGTSVEKQFRSSSGSLAEFEYIEQQLQLNEELESEALKVATMLEKGHASSSNRSPETGSSQTDVCLSKEQIPESSEKMSAEEIVGAQPVLSADTGYPRYQDIVHIIREASKNVQTFQLGDQQTSQSSIVTETVSQIDGSASLRQEKTSELYHADISSANVSTDSTIEREQHDISVIQHMDKSEHSVSSCLKHDLSCDLESNEFSLSYSDYKPERREITDIESEVKTAILSDDLTMNVEALGSSSSPDIQRREMSTDSLVGTLSDYLMLLSTDSLQTDVVTSSSDSVKGPDSSDIHSSSTATLSSTTTLLVNEEREDDGQMMERSIDSLESDSREPSGEWVTVYEADSAQVQHKQKTIERDIMNESVDSLEAEFGVAGDVSGSASYDSFEADSLQDDVEEETTLVSSQSQDSLMVASGCTTLPMDISFGSSGAWSQSNVSSCTTLASSSDGETLMCSSDTSTYSSSAPAGRRLSEPSSSTAPALWTTDLSLTYDNTTSLLDSEGNVLIAHVSDEPSTPRFEDSGASLDNRQAEAAEKQSQTFVDWTTPAQHIIGDAQAGETSSSAAVLPGILLWSSCRPMTPPALKHSCLVSDIYVIFTLCNR